LIQVLPDHIANQIAAGEVIQRPASAVKELLENAVDAGATSIELIIQDAGKSLVQVVDNGKGMSVEDARLCIARHATSKISTIEDLFHIRTMGFRGEALASIAAVAQVELKTKQAANKAGIFIEVEHSAITREEPIGMANGTSLAMKNLFFNIPARRNFLKSNAAEMRHIVEEFTRVALAFPAIQFSLHANNQQLYQLESGSLKQRIVQLLGNSYASKLVGVQEETDYLTIRGFVGKPDSARKTRGDQYFFVNNRFIKSSYLHHAVMNAFQALLPADHFPLYVLFIDLDPQQVDINVHPTKQEIKFEDEKIVYAFVQAAIRHALAQFSITPTLDFELDASIQQLSITVFQLLDSYILFSKASTCTLINQQAAHERILYEKLIQQLENKKAATQPSLFPTTLSLNPTDASLLEELLDDLIAVGFLIQRLNTHDFQIQGIPAGFENGKEESLLEAVLEEYKNFNAGLSLSLHEKLCRSLAKQQAIKTGTQLSEREMKQLITDLFACKEPYLSPFGAPTFRTLKKEEVEQLLLNR